MLVGDEADTPEAAVHPAQTMQESAEWWNAVNPMTLTQARQHRTRLQTILKRRQYAALAGYVSRELRGEQELSRMCFAFVPLLIEAIWSQHAEASLEELTEGLRQSSAHRPRDRGHSSGLLPAVFTGESEPFAGLDSGVFLPLVP